MKDEAALNEFLQNEVNLNQSRYYNAQGRLNTLKNHLKDNLKGFAGTEIQGSYATRTVIKPVADNDGYDIDLMVYIKHDGAGILWAMGLVGNFMRTLRFPIMDVRGKARVSRSGWCWPLSPW